MNTTPLSKIEHLDQQSNEVEIEIHYKTVPHHRPHTLLYTRVLSERTAGSGGVQQAFILCMAVKKVCVRKRSMLLKCLDGTKLKLF